MNSNVPFIPDNAPFTPEQRAWLNGMLAGIAVPFEKEQQRGNPNLLIKQSDDAIIRL